TDAQKPCCVGHTLKAVAEDVQVFVIVVHESPPNLYKSLRDFSEHPWRFFLWACFPRNSWSERAARSVAWKGSRASSWTPALTSSIADSTTRHPTRSRRLHPGVDGKRCHAPDES